MSKELIGSHSVHETLVRQTQIDAARIEELERDLLNLVCRIHRDGGHYIAKYGEAKAIADADTVAAQNNADLDALQADNARLREALKHYAQEDIRNARHYPPEFAKEALAATPEQSLAASELGKERDQLRAQINVLREAFQTFIDEHEECQDADEWMAELCSIEALHVAGEALAATPEQSLAAYQNKATDRIEKLEEALANILVATSCHDLIPVLNRARALLGEDEK